MKGILDRNWWRAWRIKLQRRAAIRLLEKQRLVLREGICIRARVVDFYDSGRKVNGLHLFRVRIAIRFPDGVLVQVLSNTLSSHLPSSLRDCPVRMKILAGDLNHIVILS